MADDEQPNPAVQAVSLDAAGTIIEVAEPVATVYSRLAAEQGGEMDPEALAAGFRKHFPAMPPMAFEDAQPQALARLERGWWRTLVRRVVAEAGTLDDFEAYFDTLYAHYASPASWRLYDDVLALIEALAAAGIRIGVLSNFDSRLPPILDALGVTQRVSCVLYSTAIGFAKPAAGAFGAVTAALEVPPSACMHVGDNRQADFDGAAKAGLQARLLDRGTGAKRMRKVPTIKSLQDLISILEIEHN